MSYKVAIITRTKNRPVLLKRALRSVALQNFQDYIHVIVNDGGDENEIKTLLQSIPQEKTSRIILHSNPISVGMEASSNIGIKNSTSKYIVLLDDDDTWEPDFLSTTIKYLDENPAIYGIATQANIVMERIVDDQAIILTSRPFKPHIKSHTLYENCRENNILVHTFVYRRSCLETVGLYDEKLSVLGDWDFNLRFLLHYDIHLISNRLANYHIRINKDYYGNTITRDTAIHSTTRMIINNKTLRNDLLNNSLGLGYLINSASLPLVTNLKILIRNLYYDVTDKLLLFKIIRHFFPSRHTKILRSRFHEDQ